MILALLGAAGAATLSGSVEGEDGTPLGGVTVVAYDTRLNYATATTNTSGAWTMRNVPAGRYRVRALPDDTSTYVDRFAPSTWDFCAGDVWEVAEADVADGVDLVLPLGAELSGRVVGADGLPREGAQVLAYGASPRTELIGRIAYTDADGFFTVTGLDSDAGAAEPYRVQVVDGGVPDQFLGATYDEDAAATFDVELGEALDVGDHALLEGIVVRGTISGPAGPVAEGTVYAYSSSQVMSVDVGADGGWEADGLPPGQMLFWASSPGLATTYLPDPEDPDDPGDRPSGRIDASEEGAVVEGADLALPVESTATFVFEGDGDVGETAVLLYNSDASVGRGDAVAEDGTVTIDALHDGAYTLFVYGDDGGFTSDWLRGDDGQPEVLLVEGPTTFRRTLPPGARLGGTVVDDEGEPVYGAYVYTVPVEGDSEATATEADGAWSIGGLLTQDARLKAVYSYVCPNDPGYVTTWYGGALEEDLATWLPVAAGESRDDVDLTMARDFDHDAMGDAWESDHGLDTDRDDAGEDADGDGLTNLDEFLLGTDPTDPSDGPGGKGCGCGGGGGQAALLALPLLWRRRRQGT